MERRTGAGGLRTVSRAGWERLYGGCFDSYPAWSRRINDEHRIVYKVQGDSLLIAQLRYHY